jgi:hypothetical protein
MKTMIRSIALAVAAVAAAVSQPAAALAAPAPFEGLLVTCPGYGEVVVSSPGNGIFAPSFLPDGDDVLVPYRVEYVLSGDTGRVSVSDAKSAPLPPDAVTCVFDVTFHVQGTAYHLAGSFTGVVRGRP